MLNTQYSERFPGINNSNPTIIECVCEPEGEAYDGAKFT